MPSPPPVFFPEDFPTTIADVMKSPLHLDRPPFEYNLLSPTPMDPLHLYIDDVGLYGNSAIDYMDHMQRRAVKKFFTIAEIADWVEERIKQVPAEVESSATDRLRVSHDTWGSIRQEITVQHELKSHRHDAAVQLLVGDSTEIDRETAESIMQLRAGVASISTALRFLAAKPQLGGIELQKCTRPLSPVGINQAKIASTQQILAASEKSLVIDYFNDGHYRSINIEDPNIIVLKTMMARVAVGGSLLEVIRRDSGVILRPGLDDPSLGYAKGVTNRGRDVVIAPIGFTVYGRVAAIDS